MQLALNLYQMERTMSSMHVYQILRVLMRLRCLLDRPSLQKIILEYGNIVWYSCNLENKRTIENKQLEAARLQMKLNFVVFFKKLYDNTN